MRWASDDGSSTSFLIDGCAAFGGLIGLLSCSQLLLGGGLIGTRGA